MQAHPSHDEAGRGAGPGRSGRVWVDASAAAGLCFLVVAVLGGLLVMALKLRFPQLGGTAQASDVLGAVGIAALAVLGTPIHFGGATLWSLPMGALAVVALAIFRAGADMAHRNPEADPRARFVNGARIGIPFAGMCLVVSLVSDAGASGRHLGVTPIVATVLGAWWAGLFGGLGALLQRPFGFRGLPDLDHGWTSVVGALRVSLLAGLAVASVLSAVLVAGRIGQGFFGGHSGGTGAAALVLLGLAFAPNVVITLACAGLGAPLRLGAGVLVGKQVVGPHAGLSLFGWTDHALPGWAIVFVAVPLVAGWVAARRLARDPCDATTTVGRASLTGLGFGVVMAVGAFLARAHLGLRIVHSAGFASIGPDPLFTLIFGSLSVALVAGCGAIALRKEGSPGE